MAALARAQRLQRDVRSGDAAPLQIEAALRQAIEVAPQWVEARRALARWHSSRRLWNAAAPAWQAVLQLRPSDREARLEIERVRRWAGAFPGTSPWKDISLVSFGVDSRAAQSDLVTLRTSAQTRPAGARIPDFRLSDSKPAKAVFGPSVAPARIAAKRGATAEEIRSALGVITDNGTGEAASTTQVPEDLNSVPIADDNAMAGAALPSAPAGVGEEARVALARARQMAALSAYLPEAQAWATTEFRRATELAPQWTQAQRERAQWHTARGEWDDAATAWTALLDAAPDDREARLALTKTRELTVAHSTLGERNLVTFGHDSGNPAAQPMLAALNAPAEVAKTVTAPAKMAAAPIKVKTAALINAVVGTSHKKSKKTNADAARLAALRAKPAVKTAKVPPSLARPVSFNKSSTLIANTPLIVSQLTLAVRRASQAITIPAPMIRVSSQVAPALIPEDINTPPIPAASAPAEVTAPNPAPDETLVPVTEPIAPAPGDNAVPVLQEAPAPDNGTALVPIAPQPMAPPAEAKIVYPPIPRAKTAPVKAKAKPKAKPRAAKVSAATKVSAAALVSRKRKAAAWPWVNQAGKAMKARNFSAALANYQRAYAIDPTNTYAALGIPESLMILKRYPEAIRGYEQYLRAHPGDAKALRGLADSYAFDKQYDRAAQLDAAILAKKPRDLRAALQAAQVMSWAKNYEESARFYRMALGIAPKNASIWTEYAETLTFAKDPRAREAFNQALALDPESQRTMIGLANLLSWSGEYANSIPVYRGVLVRDPANLAAQIGLGDALTFAGQSESAIPVYQQALQMSPNSEQARLGLGRALTIAHRYSEALGILGPLVKEQPANAEALNMLGIAQIGEQPGAALTTFQELLKLQTEPRARAATLANIGDLEVKLGHSAEARAAYEEAMKLTPGDDKIALAFGRALMRQELYTDAEPLITGVVQRDPANQAALLLQATLAARMDQKERAAALTRQIEAMPLEVTDDALNLFYALRSAGATEEAGRLLGHLTQSGARRPEDALKVANAVRDSGHEEASYELYKRVLQDNPDLHEARLELVEALIRRKEFDAAHKEVNYVLTRQPGNVSARILSATLALRRDRTEASFDNAEIVYREALDKNAGNAQARLGLAEVFGTRSKFPEAVQNYRIVLESDPENLQARLGLARNLYYARQVPESIKEYQDLILRAPDDMTVKLELAQVYLDRNLLDDAQRLFLEVLKAAKYPLPEAGVVQLFRRVPGSGDALTENTRRAFRDFAANAQKSVKPTQ